MSNRLDRDALTREAARIIREEHEALKALLERIRATSAIPDLLPLLTELRTLLASHFQHEETPGSLASLTREPRLAGQVDELFEEHTLFLRMLDDLLRQSQETLDSANEVIRGVRELSRQLHEHEGRENALILDLADTDLGGGD